MSRKRNRGVIILSSMLCFTTLGTLVACQPQNTEYADTEWKDFIIDTSITGLSVSNLSDLQGEWKLGESDRKISLSITPTSLTIDALLSQKKVMAKSSDDSVVSVSGLTLKALKVGSSTITVRAGKERTEFKVTITEEPKKESVVYNFANNESDSGFTDNDLETAYDYISSCAVEGNKVISSITSFSKMYYGYKDSSSGKSYLHLGLKFGTSKVAGELSFTLTDKNIKKMTIKGIGWTAEDTITVGDTSYTSKYKYSDESMEIGIYEFGITSTAVTISLNKRYYIQSITFDY